MPNNTVPISRRGVVAAGTMGALALAGCIGSGSTGGSTSSTGSAAANFLGYTDPVTVTGGDIRGCAVAGETGSTVEAYLGIPYAAPPVGERRWCLPQDLEPWDGVLSCTSWGASAIQEAQSPFFCWTEEFIIQSKTYSEDCLTLNIWTTTDACAAGTEAGLPVIVYIHGGAFTSGGSSCAVYEGEDICQRGVVFVSINYRLGIFGYLATTELLEEAGTAGNYGMADQIRALEWVQANIAAFGGDPGNVTIMGQSAGGQGVTTLVMSPAAAGLFHHAVIMSTNGMVDMAFASVEERALAGDDATDGMSLEELRALPADELLSMGWSGDGLVGACVDGVYLLESYPDALVGGSVNDVDLMVGMTDNEENPLWAFQSDAWYYDHCEDGVSSTEGLMGALNYQGLAREAAGSYTGGLYVFDFHHMMPGAFRWLWGAFHTSDVPYFLDNLVERRASYWQDEDYELADTMSSYLVNFATTGDPNGEGLATWEPNVGDWTYLQLDTTCAMQQLGAEEIEAISAYHEELAYLLA